MKKLLTILLMSFVFASAQAQFKVGPQVALPAGDASDFYSFVWGVDAYYMFGNADRFLNFGPATGFINFIGDEVDIVGTPTEIDNAQFIPVAGALRFVILSTLTAGADVGYGIGLNEGNDGGFYWRANAGIDLGNVIELNAFYYSISVSSTGDSNFNYGAFGLNLLFEIGGKK